jgi:hypothetical protein
MKIDLFFVVSPKENQLILPFPKLNFCEMFQFSNDDLRLAFVSNIIREMSRFGNISATCPVKKGDAYLKSFFIEDKLISKVLIFTDSAQYMAQLVLTDENKRKPKLVFKYNFFVKIVKDREEVYK